MCREVCFFSAVFAQQLSNIPEHAESSASQKDTMAERIIRIIDHFVPYAEMTPGEEVEVAPIIADGNGVLHGCISFTSEGSYFTPERDRIDQMKEFCIHGTSTFTCYTNCGLLEAIIANEGDTAWMPKARDMIIHYPDRWGGIRILPPGAPMAEWAANGDRSRCILMTLPGQDDPVHILEFAPDPNNRIRVIGEVQFAPGPPTTTITIPDPAYLIELIPSTFGDWKYFPGREHSWWYTGAAEEVAIDVDPPQQPPPPPPPPPTPPPPQISPIF